MPRWRASCIAAGIVLPLLSGMATAEPALLSKEAATAKAVAILKGNPYGDNAAEVRGNLAGITLIHTGKSACGPVERPQWSFHVRIPKPKGIDPVQPIDGHLVLDAATGKMVCAGLPFLN